MKKEHGKNLGVKDGILAGLPIVIGYIPIAMAFGILSKTIGISIKDSLLFSAFVFAGASQFMALNLLHLGTGVVEIVLTTLLVNFRHFLMSASLATRITKDMKKWIPFFAFGVTDEIFSVVAFTKEQITKEFMIALQLSAYLSWVLGTGVGYLVGEILPNNIKSSMGIALYAMFAAILIPEAKKSNRVLVMALLSGLINTLLNYLNITTQGWNLVFTIVFVSAIGAFTFKEEKVSAYE